MPALEHSVQISFLPSLKVSFFAHFKYLSDVSVLLKN
jgi:hypothetical protein